MNKRHDRELERLLDQCIDELLDGRNWANSVPESSSDEIDPLMKIAQQLQQGSETAALSTGHEKRISTRISRILRLTAHLHVWRLNHYASATPHPALSWSRLPIHVSLETSPRGKPDQGF